MNPFLKAKVLTSFKISNNKSVGTLSNTPSVAANITSPFCTGKLSVSADSGLSLNTFCPGGGSDN